MTKKNVSKGAHAFKTLKEVLQILNRNELIYTSSMMRLWYVLLKWIDCTNIIIVKWNQYLRDTHYK